MNRPSMQLPPILPASKFLGTNKFTCMNCFPDAVEIGPLSDELWLIYWNGHYHLIDNSCLEQGRISTFLVFDRKPVPYDINWRDEPEMTAWDADYARLEERLYMKPDDGYKLVSACMLHGYAPTGTIELSFFLLHLVGIIIERWEKRHG